jgi:hypothetical protein
VARGDRVEVFFAKDPDLEDYYCIEMAPNGKILDYTAFYYRQFNNSWDFPKITVEARVNDGGYTIEGKIPLQVHKDLGILKENKPSCFLMGVYRGEFSHSDSGNIKEEWISWIKPNTEEPDFHVPSSFASLCIESKQ